MERIPKSYKQANWRNTTPVEKTNNTIGVSFNMSDGSVMRLCLPVVDAKNLSESIHSFLYNHSEISSGMPSVDVSTPLGSEKV